MHQIHIHICDHLYLPPLQRLEEESYFCQIVRHILSGVCVSETCGCLQHPDSRITINKISSSSNINRIFIQTWRLNEVRIRQHDPLYIHKYLHHLFSQYRHKIASYLNGYRINFGTSTNTTKEKKKGKIKPPVACWD